MPSSPAPFRTSSDPPPVRLVKHVVGPRIPEGEVRDHPVRYLLPTVLLAAAALCLVGSAFLPWWGLTLHAPQYPGGLHVEAYLNHLTGDVAEIDGLNHYIGMRPLGEAAPLERSLSLFAVAAVALLVAGTIFIHTRFAAWLSLPALALPAVFLADLQYWLWSFGRDLDPYAPLSSSIKPFVPPVLGEGVVGQFRTTAYVESGFLLAGAASVLILVGLFFHRRAYRPLVEAARGRPRKT